MVQTRLVTISTAQSTRARITVVPFFYVRLHLATGTAVKTILESTQELSRHNFIFLRLPANISIIFPSVSQLYSNFAPLVRFPDMLIIRAQTIKCRGPILSIPCVTETDGRDLI